VLDDLRANLFEHQSLEILIGATHFLFFLFSHALKVLNFSWQILSKHVVSFSLTTLGLPNFVRPFSAATNSTFFLTGKQEQGKKQNNTDNGNLMPVCFPCNDTTGKQGKNEQTFY
jgi:hypothetical protein